LLADGTKRNLNRTSTDLSAFPVVVALPDPASETEKEVDCSVGFWHLSEHFIHTSEGLDVLLAPKLPIALPLVVVIRSHEPSVNILPAARRRSMNSALAIQAEDAPRVVFVDPLYTSSFHHDIHILPH
jgi:hypothetical protein